jgi:hypothetical protein
MTRRPVCSLCHGRGYTIETPKSGKLFAFCECARGRGLRGWIEEFFYAEIRSEREGLAK